MSRPVNLNSQYILRMYSNNAILFSQEEGCDNRILNRFEKEILACVDGEKSINELMDTLCKMYSISNVEEMASEYQVLRKYIDSLLEEGILVIE